MTLSEMHVSSIVGVVPGGAIVASWQRTCVVGFAERVPPVRVHVRIVVAIVDVAASPTNVQRVAPARPFFVVMTMTPFAASVPYSVAADGPFTISMSSISSGLSVLSSEKRRVGARVVSVARRDAHAVDDPDRRVAQADRRDAAMRTVGAPPSVGSRQHDDAGRFGGQHVGGR